MPELIVALDLPHAASALAMVDRLPDLKWVKVGSVLATREGPELVRELVGRSINVFLDLKWHDIPNTVADAVRGARSLGVKLATVHTLGGAAMMKAGVEAGGDAIALVGVTVLTSHDADSYASVVGRPEVDLAHEVGRLAMSAMEAGLAGVVCSPREVALVRSRLAAGSLIVVPGIRRRRDAREDQVRVASAAEAVAAGATHLVVGRPVIQAADPAMAFAEFLEEMQCVGS
ncbi:MAG: orotidine-5'-phosphate decarboxylase [Gemmatimonadales bacterium]